SSSRGLWSSLHQRRERPLVSSRISLQLDRSARERARSDSATRHPPARFRSRRLEAWDRPAHSRGRYTSVLGARPESLRAPDTRWGPTCTSIRSARRRARIHCPRRKGRSVMGPALPAIDRETTWLGALPRQAPSAGHARPNGLGDFLSFPEGQVPPKSPYTARQLAELSRLKQPKCTTSSFSSPAPLRASHMRAGVGAARPRARRATHRPMLSQ